MSNEKLIIGAIAGDIIGSVYELDTLKLLPSELIKIVEDFSTKHRK